MYCRNCGNKLPEGARFCGACGAEQKQSMVNADEKQPETVYQEMNGKTVEKQDVISSDEGADKILDYYRASKGVFLCIQKNKRILHYGYIIKQSL